MSKRNQRQIERKRWKRAVERRFGRVDKDNLFMYALAQIATQAARLNKRSETGWL